MVFSSLVFLFRFLPFVLCLYFICPKQYRNAVLFFVSLLFYAWGEPVYVILMLFSTAVDYSLGRLVQKALDEGNKKKAGRFVFTSAAINLSLLCLFKYADFLIGTANSLFHMELPLLYLPLPIGISFYTFQTMSYTIDIYRGQAKPQHNILSFGAYVCLFPQLIAGPIVRYQTIADELTDRQVTADHIGEGIRLFLTGLGKKVLLANQIGLVWKDISAMPVQTLPAVTAWLGIFAFAFQIYFDFSGYSDMARGLGLFFGFHFPENFRYPYLSKSITEFWRRWHITLGTWFREYVYIPLGGNRCTALLQLRNILAVWLLTGIWHGASFNFIVWGLYFGLLLIVEKLIAGRVLARLPRYIGHAYTILLVLLSWVIFAFESFSDGASYLKAMAGLNQNPLINSQTIYLLYTNGLLLFILAAGSTPLPKKLAASVSSRLNKTGGRAGEWTDAILSNLFYAGILFLSTAYLVDATYNPFLYFRF